MQLWHVPSQAASRQLQIAHLRRRLLNVSYDQADVVREDAVQRGSPLAVLPQHEQTNVLLRRGRAAHF